MKLLFTSWYCSLSFVLILLLLFLQYCLDLLCSRAGFLFKPKTTPEFLGCSPRCTKAPSRFGYVSRALRGIGSGEAGVLEDVLKLGNQTAWARGLAQGSEAKHGLLCWTIFPNVTFQNAIFQQKHVSYVSHLVPTTKNTSNEISEIGFTSKVVVN